MDGMSQGTAILIFVLLGVGALLASLIGQGINWLFNKIGAKDVDKK